VNRTDHRSYHMRMPAMSTPESNKPDRWQWVGLALLTINGLLQVIHPPRDLGLRIVAMYVLFPATIFTVGYLLYRNYRERRGRRDAPNGT
jgi:hypothetical protein